MKTDNDEELAKICENISKLREQKGLTVKGLSKECGVSVYMLKN